MATTLNTTEYRFSHGKAPRGRGYWGFQRPQGGDIVWLTGTLTECKRQLAGGEWIVCP